jgi:hypothetical protein
MKYMASEERTEVQSRLLLDVIIRKGPAVFKLLASKDQTLLVGRNTLLVLNLRFHVVDGIGGFNFERNGLAGKSLHEDLHTATESEDEMKSGLLLNVVIRQRAAILELFPGENKTLLVRGDTTFIPLFRSYHKCRGTSNDSPFLVLNLSLDIVDRVRRLDLESDGLAGQGLDKDLHTAAQTKHQVEGGFFLDIIVRKGTPIFQLLPSEDEALLVRWNAVKIIV